MESRGTVADISGPLAGLTASQMPPAITRSATIPTPRSKNIERCFGAVGLVGFACAALPTSSE